MLLTRLRAGLAFLRDRPMLQRVGANAGWIMGERLVRILLGLLVGLWVARHLGPRDFGELSFALAYAALWGALANLGLEAITVRELARRPDAAGNILGTVAILRLAAGAAAAVLGLACSLLMEMGTGGQTLMVAVVLFGLIFQSADVVDCWFQAHLKSRLTVTARLVALVAGASLKVLMIYLDAPLIVFAWIALFESALIGAFLMLNYRSNPCPQALAWDGIIARSILRDSLPIMLSGLAIMIYMRIDQIMLRELAGPAQLGLFSAVLPFSEGWYVIGTSLCTSLLPMFSRLYGEDRERFLDHLQKLLAGLSGLGLVISAATFLGSEVIVGMLLGPKYAGGAAVLGIHCWGIVFVFIGVAENLWMISGNFSRLRLIKTALGAACNIALNLLLIPGFGARGAACATVVSFAVSVYLSNALLNRALFAMQTRALLLQFRRRPQAA